MDVKLLSGLSHLDIARVKQIKLMESNCVVLALDQEASIVLNIQLLSNEWDCVVAFDLGRPGNGELSGLSLVVVNDEGVVLDHED
jgi:hypothetical protein